MSDRQIAGYVFITGQVAEEGRHAINIATHSEGCIALHARGAFRAGTTRSELVETIGVALEMGGGTAMVYGLAALDAHDQFMQAELSSDKVE